MASDHQARIQLICTGLVQGVGLRPALHRLASGLDLKGSIENCSGGVELDLWGARTALEGFLERLPAAIPQQAQLESIQRKWRPAASAPPTDLRIGVAEAELLGPGWVAPALVSDMAPCLVCRSELADPRNRRYRYPFISCCSCGPRYSIATAQPFTRANTTLASLALCEQCQREFDDPGDRRFHAETIGCPDCGPRLQWLGAGRHALDHGDPLAQAIATINAGGIVALQGVGGFQLLVDATNADAVERLRRLKGRPAKPLALLVAELDPLEPWLQISAAERQALHAAAAPIVLLRRRLGPIPCPIADGVAGGSHALGVMLPASPLHLLLAQEARRPLVATSGNRSGEPLWFTPEQAQLHLLEPRVPIADGLLLHDRAVARPLDDSVLQIIDGQPQVLRRARGYAPAALQLPIGVRAAGGVLALGGDLNAAPALALRDRVWLAAHQGDLSDSATHRRWEQGLAALMQRHGSQLETICSDGHPAYQSVQWARQQCRQRSPLRHHPVQHHLAHGLAVLAEHGVSPPALVVAFDGLGYGEGPAVLWGGEALLLDAQGGFMRPACLRPFVLPGADQAALEPRRAALGLLHCGGMALLDHAGARATRAAFGTQELILLEQALAAGLQCPLTSSAGRLFDAAASLLDLLQVRSYEGQAGQLLQAAAALAMARGADLSIGYSLPLVPAPAGHPVRCWWDWQPLLTALLDDRKAGVDAGVCGLRVHRAWIEAVVALVLELPGLPVVLCGGCFQNRLLLQGTIDALRRVDRPPLWAQQLPPGDGGLALGQVMASCLGRKGSSGDATPLQRSATAMEGCL